mmetsp:Transcript_9195/g.15095  ORF Transcript_9195/g.15095 Transcript_9195/m.15095 type:complete len:92 (-) Transcript_9195:154-429(-)
MSRKPSSKVFSPLENWACSLGSACTSSKATGAAAGKYGGGWKYPCGGGHTYGKTIGNARGTSKQEQQAHSLHAELSVNLSSFSGNGNDLVG